MIPIPPGYKPSKKYYKLRKYEDLAFIFFITLFLITLVYLMYVYIFILN